MALLKRKAAAASALEAVRIKEADEDHEGPVMAFTLNGPVDAGILSQEIADAHATATVPGITIDGDRLYVHGDGIKMATVRKVVAKHQPSEPDPEPEWHDKVRQGQDLTDSEIQQALRLLLRGRL